MPINQSMRRLVALLLLALSGGTPALPTAPTAVVVATSRGEAAVPVQSVRGHPAVAVT